MSNKPEINNPQSEVKPGQPLSLSRRWFLQATALGAAAAALRPFERVLAQASGADQTPIGPELAETVSLDPLSSTETAQINELVAEVLKHIESTVPPRQFSSPPLLESEQQQTPEELPYTLYLPSIENNEAAPDNKSLQPFIDGVRRIYSRKDNDEQANDIVVRLFVVRNGVEVELERLEFEGSEEANMQEDLGSALHISERLMQQMLQVAEEYGITPEELGLIYPKEMIYKLNRDARASCSYSDPTDSGAPQKLTMTVGVRNGLANTALGEMMHGLLPMFVSKDGQPTPTNSSFNILYERWIAFMNEALSNMSDPESYRSWQYVYGQPQGMRDKPGGQSLHAHVGNFPYYGGSSPEYDATGEWYGMYLSELMKEFFPNIDGFTDLFAAFKNDTFCRQFAECAVLFRVINPVVFGYFTYDNRNGPDDNLSRLDAILARTNNQMLKNFVQMLIDSAWIKTNNEKDRLALERGVVQADYQLKKRDDGSEPYVILLYPLGIKMRKNSYNLPYFTAHHNLGRFTKDNVTVSAVLKADGQNDRSIVITGACAIVDSDDSLYPRFAVVVPPRVKLSGEGFDRSVIRIWVTAKVADPYGEQGTYTSFSHDIVGIS